MKHFLISSVIAASLAACGAIYHPQSAGDGPFNYADVIHVTHENVETFNRGGYAPRPLPAALSGEARLAWPKAELQTIKTSAGVPVEAKFLRFDASGPLSENKLFTQRDLDELVQFRSGLEQNNFLERLEDFEQALSVSSEIRLNNASEISGAPNQEYMLQPGDSIRVYQRSKFTETSGGFNLSSESYSEVFTLDGQGNIYFDDGTVLNAAGKTVADVNRRVAGILSRIRPDVDSRVEIEDFKSQYVTILTDKNSSVINVDFRQAKLVDLFPLIELSPIQSQIYIFRNDSSFYLDGSELIANPEKYTIPLRPNDIIYVSDKLKHDTLTEYLTIEAAKQGILRDIATFKFSLTSFLAELDERERNNQRWITDRRIELEKYNQSETVRVAQERSERAKADREEVLKEFEFQVSERDKSIQNFLNLVDKRVLEQDTITLTGEFVRQESVTLPFGRHMTVAEAVYDHGKGINIQFASPKRVFLFRSYQHPYSQFDTFQIDISGPSGMIAMQKMQVRPDDILYVDTQPLIDFSRIVRQILPVQGLGTSLIGAGTGI